MKIALFNHRSVDIVTDETIQLKWLRRCATNEYLLDRIEGCLQRHKPDLFVGPEYIFMDWHTQLTDEEHQKVMQRLVEMSKRSDVVLIPGTIVYGRGRNFVNGCPVLHGGRVVAEVRKRAHSGFDDYFKCDKKRSRYHSTAGFGKNVSAYLKRHMVNVGGLKYLVEVCVDHGFSADREDVPVPHVADVQVVLTNRVPQHFSDKRMRCFLKHEGLYVECNSYYPSSFVGRASRKHDLEAVFESNGRSVGKIAIVNVDYAKP